MTGLTELEFWFAAAIAVLVLLVVVLMAVLVGVFLGRTRPGPSLGHPKDRLDIIDDRLGFAESGLTKVQHDVSNIKMAVQALPSKDLVHRMEVGLTAVQGKVEALTLNVSTIDKNVTRISDHLMGTTVA